jgi:hypothetical protein
VRRPGNRGYISVRGRDFYFLNSAQICSGAQPASLNGRRGLLPQAEAWSWLLTSIYCGDLECADYNLRVGTILFPWKWWDLISTCTRTRNVPMSWEWPRKEATVVVPRLAAWHQWEGCHAPVNIAVSTSVEKNYYCWLSIYSVKPWFNLKCGPTEALSV